MVKLDTLKEALARPDLRFCNLGFAVSMRPTTDKGADWIADNIGDDVTAHGDSILIEPRYLADIVMGARGDGLICEG